MIRMLLVMISCGVLILLAGCSSESDSGMSFDDLAQLEQSEQGELLAMAEQAAGNWHFGSASDYLSQAEEKGYDPDAIGATKRVISRAREAYRENERRKEEQRRQEEQQRLAQERQNQSSSSNVYITSWGYDFSGDGKIWGRTGVKLSNGSSLYTWLDRSSNCYTVTVTVAGGYSGVGSNCSGSIHGVWVVAACGSGQFTVQGDQADVVRAVVGRCS